MSDNFETSEFSTVENNIEKDITLKGLASATLDTIHLYRTHSDKVTPPGALVLVGMKAAFPERFSNEQLLQNQNFSFFNHLVWLGVEVNDAVDINPQARKEGKQEVIEDIFHWWKKASRATTAAAKLNPQEADNNLLLMDNYQREILFLERSLRETPEDQLDLACVARYRELMNAISLAHNAAALLGSQELSQRLDSIPKQEMSLERLQEKYEWLTRGTCQNETERKLTALFNAAMGVQVIDDWADLDDDQRLGLSTFATEAIKKHKGNLIPAKKEIFERADNYYKKAREYGLNRPAKLGINRMFGAIKKAQRLFPKIAGGRREQLLHGGEKIITESEIPA